MFIKNEYLLFWINKKIILTCPDLIICTDINNYPLYNSDISLDKKVKVFGKKCCKLWRTPKGLKLFSPKNFGFNFKNKLLK